jgi:hypothetical protein
MIGKNRKGEGIVFECIIIKKNTDGYKKYRLGNTRVQQIPRLCSCFLYLTLHNGSSLRSIEESFLCFFSFLITTVDCMN